MNLEHATLRMKQGLSNFGLRFRITNRCRETEGRKEGKRIPAVSSSIHINVDFFTPGAHSHGTQPPEGDTSSTSNYYLAQKMKSPLGT